MKPKITEADLAKHVVAMLTEMGWEVYQEVEGPGGRCDIVAKRGQIQWAIECKLSFGFPVLEQAYNWIGRNRAHYVSVATPSYVSDLSFPYKICKQYGIGILHVAGGRRGGSDIFEVREQLGPRLYRKAKGFKLYEEQKTFCEAGGNQGGHWTPFKQTVQSLVNTVKRQPGVEFRTLIKELKHHYSSNAAAASCLRGFIGSKVIPELKIVAVERRLHVYPADYVVLGQKQPAVLSEDDAMTDKATDRPVVDNLDIPSHLALNV